MPKIQPSILPINQLQPNPFQPRDRIKKEDIQDLIKSIKTYGIIQPLVVGHTPAGYQIIAGERRWRAAREAGLEEVPVSIKKTTPQQMLELALVENVQREDLNPLERARGFQQLMKEFGFSISDLADRIGKSSSYISNSLRLIALPDAIKDGLIDNEISEGHARALSGLKSGDKMIKAFKRVLNEDASVRRTEQLVRDFKKRDEVVNKTQKKIDQLEPRVDERVRHLKKQFKKSFIAPTKVNLSRSNRQTRLTITFVGSQDKTESDLRKIIKLIKQEE